MSPRGILLGSIPVSGKYGLAEKCGLRKVNARFVLKNGDKGAA